MNKPSYTCLKCGKEISDDFILYFGLPYHTNCLSYNYISNVTHYEIYKYIRNIRRKFINTNNDVFISQWIKSFYQREAFSIKVKYTFDGPIDFQSIVLVLTYKLEGGLQLSQKNQQTLVVEITNIKMPNCLLIDHINQITDKIISSAKLININLVKQPLITYGETKNKDLGPFFFINIIREKITNDFFSNYFELKIIRGDTIYNFDDDLIYHQSKSILSANDIEECFLYYGISTSDDSNTTLLKQSDKFLFKGYYLTNNIFFGSFSGKNNFSPLKINELANVVICKVFYNKKYKQKMFPLPDLSPKSIMQNKGVITTYVGDQNQNYLPIDVESTLRLNVFAEEYIFNDVTQIIPLVKFQIIRKDYFILIKNNQVDKNIIPDITVKYQVNAYFCNTDEDALKLIRRKKANRIMLITDQSSDFIHHAREIIRSHFLCLIYSTTLQDLQWAKERDNILITNSSEMMTRYLSSEMKEDKIIRFIQELEEYHHESFTINREEILRFPLFIDDLHYNPLQTIRNMDKVMI